MALIGRPMPMMVRASLIAFAHVSPYYIDCLLRERVYKNEPKLERPKLLMERALLLTVRSNPIITHVQLRQAMLARVENKAQACVVDVNSELADGVYDSEDKAEMRKLAAQRKESAAREQASREQIEIGSKFLEFLGRKLALAPATTKASEKNDKVVKLHVNWKVALSSKERWKDLMPKIKGCTLDLVDKKRCWTASYPGVTPGSRTRTWGLAFSREAVARHCVKWAWAHHIEQTKQPCPWRF